MKWKRTLSQDYWLLDLESGANRRLTRLDGIGEMRHFDIAPDGKSIVFDRLRKNADLILIELDSTAD